MSPNLQTRIMLMFDIVFILKVYYATCLVYQYVKIRKKKKDKIYNVRLPVVVTHELQ